jgi:catechol 2,3-dioxygenase-like lactoylglutathione lyase family enzyme
MMLKDRNAATMIPARDIDETRRFYEDVLGFSVVREHPSGIMYGSGNGSFGLYPTQSGGLAQHTLMAWIVEDIETTVDELMARGVIFEKYNSPDLKTDAKGIAGIQGDRAAWFKDPEGNTLSLWQER